MRNPTFLILLLLALPACDSSREPAPYADDFIVNSAWLRANRDKVVLVDMQSKPELFDKGHIEGAVHVTVNDLRDKDRNLAPVETLAKKIGALGIGNDSDVVAYDEKGGSNASWLWFALTQLGHGKVRLLDGNLDDFKDELVSGKASAVEPKTFTPKKKPGDIVDSEWVAANLGKTAVFLDARSPEQYTGAKPKKGIKPGHLPGAINLPWNSLHGKDGKYLSGKDGERVLKDIPRDKELVLYCNSYRQAAHLQFQLARMGYTNLKAFDASIKHYQKDESRPLKTGSEP